MKYKIVTQSLAIFTIVILLGGTNSAAFNFGISANQQTEIIPQAHALKAKGTYNTEINSKLVCGDRLCSEIVEVEETEPVLRASGTVNVFPAMKNTFQSILDEKLKNPLQSGWFFGIAKTYEVKYQALSEIASDEGKAALQEEAEACLSDGLDQVINLILSPDFEHVNTAAELEEFLENNVDTSKAVDELYSCFMESDTVTEMKDLVEHADEIIIVHFALEKNIKTVAKIEDSKFSQLIEKYSSVSVADLEKSAVATSALLAWISLKTSFQEYFEQNSASDEHIAYFGMQVFESEFKDKVKSSFDSLVSNIDDPQWLVELKALLETYASCKDAISNNEPMGECLNQLEGEAVLILEALLYASGELIKEYADFWDIVAWYLNIAPYYDGRWSDLVEFVLKSPETAKELLVDTKTCIENGSAAMTSLVSALPDIKSLVDEGDIDAAKLKKFANEHGELSESLAEYAKCSADIDKRLEDVKKQTKDADEVLVVHLALANHDYQGRVSGLDDLVKAASDEAAIDFETLRRDGVAFNTLVGWILLKTVSGSSSGQISSEVADKADVFADMFGKMVSKEAFKDKMISSFKSSSENIPLPYYVDLLKKTTNGFGECIPKIISINEFGSCIKSLEGNLNKLAEPFVKIEKGIRECNESDESKKKCEDHFNNKFGPPLSNIVDKVTLLGDCVTFGGDEGNDSDCSKLLEIDERTYKSIRVCAQPGHDVECLEVLKGVYDDIAAVADQIIEDIDKEAKVVIAKIDECTKSNEGFTNCAKELGLSDETIAQINQCKSSGTEAMKCYEDAKGIIQSEISAASTVIFNAISDCLKDPATREDCAKNFGVTQETIDKVNACVETPMTAVSCYEEAKDAMRKDIANAAAPVVAAVVDCLKDPAARENCAKSLGVSQETIDKVNACTGDLVAAAGCYKEAKGVIDAEIESATDTIVLAVVSCINDPAARENCAKSLGVSQETIDKVNSCTESATNAFACYQEADSAITKEKEALSETVSEAFKKVAECTKTVDNLEKCAFQAGVSPETLKKINKCTESGGALEGCFNNFASDIGSEVSNAIPLANCPRGTTDAGLICTQAPSKSCPSGSGWEKREFLNDCVKHINICSSGMSYNTFEKRCEKAAKCPNGTDWHYTVEKCTQTPFKGCPSGSTLSLVTGKCNGTHSTHTHCDNYVKDLITGDRVCEIFKSWTHNHCSSGTSWDGAFCTGNPQISCSVGSYKSSSDLCETNMRCSAGSLSGLKLCVSGQASCPAGEFAFILGTNQATCTATLKVQCTTSGMSLSLGTCTMFKPAK